MFLLIRTLILNLLNSTNMVCSGKEVLNNMGETILEWILVGLIRLVILYSWSLQIFKMIYYKIFRIPYVKMDDKFHPIYIRTDEQRKH